jgi:hypothetical protein
MTTATAVYVAATTRRLTFWAISHGGTARSFDAGTAITVTALETGQHVMSAWADGMAYTRYGHAYRISGAEPAPVATAEEVGGIGLGTEYGDKAAELAFTLCQTAYPYLRTWADVEPETVDNYYADAHEIIRSYPNLLSFSERVRLAPYMPELAI